MFSRAFWHVSLESPCVSRISTPHFVPFGLFRSFFSASRDMLSALNIAYGIYTYTYHWHSLYNICLCCRRPVPNIPPRIPDRPYSGRLNWASPSARRSNDDHPCRRRTSGREREVSHGPITGHERNRKLSRTIERRTRGRKRERGVDRL